MTMSWQKEEIEVESGEKVSAQMPVIVSASRSTEIPAFYSAVLGLGRDPLYSRGSQWQCRNRTTTFNRFIALRG